MFLSVNAFAEGWNTNPNNWKNNESNWENSGSNWNNSPQNWDNSPKNPYRENALYNEDGKSIGYVVPKEDGGSNIFTNEGKRIGFTPAEE
jgi:hypothetical protein